MVINNYGKLRFFDDEPVELDCGCFAVAGNYYNVFTVKYVKNGEAKRVTMTCCEDKECESKILYELLEEVADVSCDLKYVKSVEDEYEEYQDYLSNRDYRD